MKLFLVKSESCRRGTFGSKGRWRGSGIGMAALAILFLLSSSSVAREITVYADSNAVSVSDLFPGGSPVWVDDLHGQTYEFSIEYNDSYWYPGGPRYGQVYLYFQRVAAIDGVPVPEEGGSPVALHQATLAEGETLEIEFQQHDEGYLGMVGAFVMDSGNQDNGGRIVIQAERVGEFTCPLVYTSVDGGVLDLILLWDEVETPLTEGISAPLNFQEASVRTFDSEFFMVGHDNTPRSAEIYRLNEINESVNQISDFPDGMVFDPVLLEIPGDGLWLYFGGFIPYGSLGNLYRMRTDGSEVQRLTGAGKALSDGEYERHSGVTLSVDGGIIFSYDKNPNYGGSSEGDLVMTDPDGQNPVWLTDTPDIGEAWPVTNHVGNLIAYATGIHGEPCQLVLSDLTGTLLSNTRVVADSLSDFTYQNNLAWTREGCDWNGVLFSANYGMSADIWLYDVEEDKLIRVTWDDTKDEVEPRQRTQTRIHVPGPNQANLTAARLSLSPSPSNTWPRSLSYSLPGPISDGTILIHDIVGRAVETIHIGEMSRSGVVALNRRSPRLASGRYFVQLKGDGRTLAKSSFLVIR